MEKNRQYRSNQGKLPHKISDSEKVAMFGVITIIVFIVVMALIYGT